MPNPNCIKNCRLEFSKDFKRCSANVMVNNTLTMSGNQIAVVNQLIKPISILHLGGLPQEKFKEHVPTAGFMGCITDLKVNLFLKRSQLCLYDLNYSP